MAEFSALSADDFRAILAAFGTPARASQRDEERGESASGPSATLGRFFPEESPCR
jgi:hypothetical protein